jgi:hypothetical protein
MRLLISGCTATFRRISPAYKDVLGLLLTPAQGNRAELFPGFPWAADNAAYSGFCPNRYQRMLDKIKGKAGCLFVTVPDVVGDAKTTLALFDHWKRIVRLQCGQPLALVGQDGLEGLEIPWDDFQAFFIGGTTEWKLSRAAGDLAYEAKRRGKHLHMGRVNSMRRMLAAHMMLCDSVDGTRVSLWGELYMEKFARHARSLNEQISLEYPP